MHVLFGRNMASSEWVQRRESKMPSPFNAITQNVILLKMSLPSFNLLDLQLQNTCYCNKCTTQNKNKHKEKLISLPPSQFP